jgi:hypothetical protein
MSNFDFTELTRVLLEWPSRELSELDATPMILGRIQQILETARSDGCFESHPDLMVLIRQLLISRSHTGQVETLTVPRDRGWPDAADWEACGFHLTKAGTRFLLEAKSWRPDWLGPRDDQPGDLFEHEHQAKMVRRRDKRLPMGALLA